MADLKEQSSIKIMGFEETIGQLQRECADLRLSVVKSRRVES
jgi:hypothetical protein